MSHLVDRRPRARLRLAPAALALLLLAAPAIGAQSAPASARDPWRTPRVLKWTLLAVSAGIGLWAWSESRGADDAYADLHRLCRTDEARCALGESGTYADPRAESYFRAANAGDRRARVGLVAGQAALLGSAAFFIVDLGENTPRDNIPYDPDRKTSGSSPRASVGLRVPLPRLGRPAP